jgi:hypothetical protein
MVHAGLVVKAVEESSGNELDEVAVSFVIFGEKNKVVRTLGFAPAVLVAVGSDIDLAAGDRNWPPQRDFRDP